MTDSKGPNPVDFHLYSAAAQSYLYSENTMWNRFQVLLVLQAAILGGAYSIRSLWMAPVLAFLGAFLTFLLTVVAYADYRDRERQRGVVEPLWRMMLMNSSITTFGEFAKHPFTEQPYWKRFVDAATMIFLVMGLFFIADIVIGVLLIWEPSIFPAAMAGHS